MAGENRSYTCPSCGAKLVWSPTAQKIVCPYCGSQFAPGYFDGMEQQVAEDLAQHQYAKGEDAAAQGYNDAGEATDASGWDPADLRVYRCSSCGAEIVTDKTTAATNCAFCGSPVVLTEQLDTAFRPKWIMPFRVERAKAEEIYWEYVKSRPFTPGLFRSAAQIEKIKSVYLPFWLYDMDMQGALTARGEQVMTTSDTHFVYTTHQVYDLERAGSMTLTRIPVDASSHSPDDAMDSIEPFDLSDLQPFRLGYLAGFLAERYDVDEKECYPRALHRAQRTMSNMLYQSISGFSSVQITAQNVAEKRRSSAAPDGSQTGAVSGIRADYALLPVYLLFTRYQGKVYLFAVNGQTGKAVGDVPASSGRMLGFFFLCFAILTAILYVLGYFFF